MKRMRRQPFAHHLLLATLAIYLLPTSLARAETWAERLGYPPGKKVVVLHAHGGGLSFETNFAHEELLKQGAVQSASAMAPCPWFADYASWASKNPNLDIGLELTLNSPLPQYRWRPMGSSDFTRSLVDDAGYMWKNVMQTMVNSSAEDVEAELEAQLRRARLAGLRPSHLTSHQGALYVRPDFIEVYLSFARRHWIPAVVVELTPQRLEEFRQQGYPLPDELIALLQDYPLPKVDDLKIVGPATSFDDKRQRVEQLIDSLQPGLTQIAFSPAVGSEALKRIDANWQQRVWIMEIAKDAQQLRDAGVILTNWREIMKRFGG